MISRRTVRHVRAPERWSGRGASLFLAGGISGCVDWQSVAVDLFRSLETRVVLLDPRRVVPPTAREARGQITWEFRNLRRADAILFWFPRETVCPIVLYELGAWAMTDKSMFVGTDLAYSRRVDVGDDLGRIVRRAVQWIESAPKPARRR